MDKRLRLVVVAVATSLALGVVPFTVGPAAGVSNPTGTFYINYIGGPQIVFFAVTKAGVDAAAKDLGINVVFQGPNPVSLTGQADLLETAVGAHAAGIAVEFNDPKALSKGILDALNANIPVVICNTQNFDPKTDQRIQRLAYVGQDQTRTGYVIAKYLLPSLKKGATVVAVDPNPAQYVQIVRGNTLAAALKPYGDKVIQLTDNQTTPAAGEAVIESFMASHGNVSAIVTQNPETALWASQWAVKTNNVGKVKIATYDLDAATIHYIEQGVITFALSQQPFMQGYMCAVELYLAAKYGMTPGNIDTAGAIVTKANAAHFGQLIQEGTGG